MWSTARDQRVVRDYGNRHNKARTLSTHVAYPGHDSEAIIAARFEMNAPKREKNHKCVTCFYFFLKRTYNTITNLSRVISRFSRCENIMKINTVNCRFLAQVLHRSTSAESFSYTWHTSPSTSSEERGELIDEVARASDKGCESKRLKDFGELFFVQLCTWRGFGISL